MEQQQFRKLINLVESVERKRPIRLNEAFSAEVILNGIAADIGTSLEQTYARMQNSMQKFYNNIKIGTMFKAAKVLIGGPAARWMYDMYYGRMQEDLYYLVNNYPEESAGLDELLNSYMHLENKMDPAKPRKVSLNILSEEMPDLLIAIGEAFNHRELIANAEKWKMHSEALVDMFSWYDAKDRLSKPEVYAHLEEDSVENIIADATKKLNRVESQANPSMYKRLGLDLQRFAEDDGIDRMRIADPKPTGPVPLPVPALHPNDPRYKPAQRKTAQDYLTGINTKVSKDPTKPTIKRPTVDKDGKSISWDEKGNAVPRVPYAQQTAKPVIKGYVHGGTRTGPKSSDRPRRPPAEELTPADLAALKRQQNRSAATTRQVATAQADTVAEVINRIMPILRTKLSPLVLAEILKKVAVSTTQLITLQRELEKRGLSALYEPEKSNLPTPVPPLYLGPTGPAKRLAAAKPGPAAEPVYDPVDRSAIKSAPRAGAATPFASNKPTTAEPTKVIYKRKAPPPINPSK